VPIAAVQDYSAGLPLYIMMDQDNYWRLTWSSSSLPIRKEPIVVLRAPRRNKLHNFAGRSRREPLLSVSRRPGHFLGTHPAVEIFPGDIAIGQRRLLERAALAVRTLGDLRRTVIADMRRKRGHQHQ
jgi:hypothetical protein